MKIKRTTSHTVQASNGSSWKSFDNNWYTDTHCWRNQRSFESESKHFEQEKHFTSSFCFFALRTWKSYIIFTLCEAFSSFTLCTHSQAPLYLSTYDASPILSRAPSNQNANIHILKQIKSVTEKRKTETARQRELHLNPVERYCSGDREKHFRKIAI